MIAVPHVPSFSCVFILYLIFLGSVVTTTFTIAYFICGVVHFICRSKVGEREKKSLQIIAYGIASLNRCLLSESEPYSGLTVIYVSSCGWYGYFLGCCIHTRPISISEKALRDTFVVAQENVCALVRIFAVLPPKMVCACVRVWERNECVCILPKTNWAFCINQTRKKSLRRYVTVAIKSK